MAVPCRHSAWQVSCLPPYGALFSIAGWLLSLPLTIYHGYFRERAYGMATQTFLPWFGEQLLALALSAC